MRYRSRSMVELVPALMPGGGTPGRGVFPAGRGSSRDRPRLRRTPRGVACPSDPTNGIAGQSPETHWAFLLCRLGIPGSRRMEMHRPLATFDALRLLRAGLLCHPDAVRDLRCAVLTGGKHPLCTPDVSTSLELKPRDPN
jgi:hypothetical protein